MATIGFASAAPLQRTARSGGRRGVIDHLQARREIGFPERDETHAKPLSGFDLPLGLGP
jgi:hypothetical protein